MALRFVLSDFGRSFATRGRGEELRTVLLSTAPVDEPVILDFAEVRRVTYSFADEFVARLSVSHRAGVSVVNAQPTVAQIIGRAVDRRGAACSR
jgi:hypothetical protein